MKNALRIKPTGAPTDDFTQTQAAKYLGVAYGTLTLRVARGLLPFRLDRAGRPMFARADLDKFAPMKMGRPRKVVPIRKSRKK